MNAHHKNVLSLFWSLPVIPILFAGILFALDAPLPFLSHSLRTVVLSCAFVSLFSFTYRKLPIFGVAAFTSLSTICLYSVLPEFLRPIYWSGAAICLVSEFLFLLRNFSLADVPLGLASFAVLSLVLVPYYTLGYSQPFNEVGVFNGAVHFDTFMHVAFSSMIKTYHTVSLGLHGLSPAEYHIGSHALMGGAAKLADLSVLNSYGYFFVLICVPLLGASIVAAAEELQPSPDKLQFVYKLCGYFFLILGTGVLIPDSRLQRFAVWASFFESESYTVSLILLMCFISLLSRAQTLSRRAITPLLICFIVAITFCKISVGFSALAMLGFWCLFSQRPFLSKEWWTQLSIGLICCPLFLISTRFINPNQADGRIQPFHFIETYVKYDAPLVEKTIVFILHHFIFPIALFVCLGFFRSFGKQQTKAVPSWLLLGTIFSLGVGLFVVMSMWIMGGSAYYFSNISMFFALPSLVMMPQIILQTIQVAKSQFQKKMLGAVIALLCVLCAASIPSQVLPALVRGKVAFLHGLAMHITGKPGDYYLQQLEAIRDDPTTIDAVVYIPRNEVEFWTSQQCRTASFLIVAVSERAALYAWPTAECHAYICSLRYHSKGQCEESQMLFSDSQLLAEAERLGFKRVIVVSKALARVISK